MIQTLVATLMWALVASLLIFRRKRTDRSVTYAALTIAIAMTLNVDGIYTVVDPLLSGTNIATLIADALLMTGLFFLGRGVMKSGEYRPRLVRAAVSVPVLLVALLAITASFLFIDRGTTTTRFMSDLGAQQQQRSTRSSTSATEHSSSRRCSSSPHGSTGTAPASSACPPHC